MTYKNAYRGIEKIHIAEIMLIIGTFLLSMIQALFFTKNFDKLIEDTGTALGIIIVIIVVIGMILTIAADIYNIWGLKIASLDDRMFYIPFFLSVLIIIADTVIGIILFITDKSVINLVIDRAEEIVELVQMVVVIVVSSKLAKTLNGTSHIKKSRVVLWIVIVNVVFSFGVGASSLLTDAHNKVLYGISEALEIISFIVYLIYVDMTIKFLKKN